MYKKNLKRYDSETRSLEEQKRLASEYKKFYKKIGKVVTKEGSVVKVRKKRLDRNKVKELKEVKFLNKQLDNQYMDAVMKDKD